ncbi:5-methyltetrahydrofolate--homocysteine methyltransferase [Candidatus Omnitrophus magneticus]|uniref:Methionine synthase n=1 Tax=Candidatus Omnitrophus magneticus TaxID=1609969 RepID=A0A0F0CJL3_9BACT|nr:5-methyltetrahydrofolate--homocysteine methyltransferase [Candidatus Omnitrophus magneticus]KJJ85726.1 5-methyltetrahydrofolate--homocysteine methyltransferase [Candidatus Omnitrophus magneticus]
MTKTFREKIKDEIVLMDGAFGTYIQELGINEMHFGEKSGCMEYLSFSSPSLVSRVHCDYFKAGADAVETNTFGANAIKLREYGLENKVREINTASVKIAIEAAKSFSTKEFPRYVVGTMGPTGILASVSDPKLGGISYKELKNIFYEQAFSLISAGVDACLIETSQDLLEMKAAVSAIRLAAKSLAKDIVIMASFTINEQGRMLLGTTPLAVMASLGYMGVDVIGINCSLGPKEMESTISFLNKYSPTYISCVPNAGLPYRDGDKTVYPLEPREMAEIMGGFLQKYKLDVLGGCCGTTPVHIKSLREIIKKHEKRKKPLLKMFSTFYEGFNLDELSRPIIAGERLNTHGSRKMKELILKDDTDGIIEIAKTQEKAGAKILDLCVALTERSTEEEDAGKITKYLAENISSALMIDSTIPKVIERALENYPGTMFINSVNLEDGGKKAREIFRIASEHSSFVIALTIDEKGMAKTVKEKRRIARGIFEIASLEYKIEPHRIIFDLLTFSLGTGENEYRDAGKNTLDAIKYVKEDLPGVMTVLGVSNISFGLSKEARKVLNAVFLHHAVNSGLDLAIANASEILEYSEIPLKARDLADALIFNREETALEKFIEYFAEQRVVIEKPERISQNTIAPIDARIKQAVIERNKLDIIPILDEALKFFKADVIINEILLSAMREVGIKFNQGELVLPHVLKSAEVMRKAIDYLKNFISKSESITRGKVLLATVFGDVHDIGKNLVKMILENNGFSVLDLGKQVSVEIIIENAKKEAVDIIGLSALLVSTAEHMRTCVKTLHERGLKYPVIIGGAPINEEFARNISIIEDGRIYEGGVFYAKDAFTGLKIAQKLCDNEEKKNILAEYHARIISADNKTQNKNQCAMSNVSKKIISRVKNRDLTITSYGARVMRDINTAELFNYLDISALFNLSWGNKIKDAIKRAEIIEHEFKPMLEDLKKSAIVHGWLAPRVVYGYFKAYSENDSIFMFDESGKIIETISFALSSEETPRETKISDYFYTREEGGSPVVFFAVTIGNKINEIINNLNVAGEYGKMFYVHGLSVQLAEALAEYTHGRIAKELSVAREKIMRYSPGYPIWKNLSDQKKIFNILNVEKLAGIKLTSAFQMIPEQSVTAVMIVAGEID